MTAVVEPAPPALSAPPELLERDEDGQRLGALLWRPGSGWRAVSSAVLGGGIGERAWVMNVQVAHGYTRTDPEAHLAELARRAGLRGPGVGLMTAAEVARRGTGSDGGVEAVATAGIEVRGWAAAPGPAVPAPQAPGTINIVVTVPAPLTDAALVNAVATATEAKVQALLDAGHDCSGTPTDAVCVLARQPPAGGPAEPFAGPRSLWGARLARAVHAAVGSALPAPGVS
ncbi:adenosylcobinamide amidohydrolase [Streptomyces omiyaensis]|uniref:adenosylcobinamide amidohydrolase n=1 Tax=Streptomyces omiyaensis TaxID=68247 RepID=UPI0016755A78|nr:adenosylcobinamide amidohydrolase [Streptomyces omiyaensis]GGY70265.1 adenosylcobinamide amidohydrolase [Streptomyces omiyaensis]